MVKLGPVREPAHPLLNHVCGGQTCTSSLYDMEIRNDRQQDFGQVLQAHA